MARIVIVEDDRDIRELIALILEEDGHTSVATATGPEALQECGHAVPDLVLLDISLPGELSGLEVCRRLRGDERLAIPGTGLGLSIVRGIATGHAGTVSVISREGVGTRVELRLPVGAPVASVTRRRDPAGPRSAGGARPG